ncbi:porin [Herbaspirillum sp. 1130]|uniref:porin n=1 Tax=Herbaspirillum sp. 1130 TaxID=2806562 RepID=UPI001AE28400|nr:porin [Herbaspirillum sp. 1130]MBP1318273.1 putative porin [Herbaspirillum sp. 1130]
MKRYIIGASMAGMAALGTGIAQAQSSVTIYGLLDTGFTHESGGAGGSINKISSGIFNGSRIGFKGAEDLGGGLSAVFLLESGFQVDTGAMGQGGLLFGRQSYVGLNGDFGSVRVGRQYTPFDVLAGTSDPFFAGSAARMTNLFGENYVGGINGYYNNRINNSVTWSSPVFGGYSGDVGYGFGETAGNMAAARYVGASFGYASGPLYLRVAHQNINTVNDDGAAKNTGFGAYYDFGVLRLHGAAAINKSTAAGVTTVDSRDLMVGAVIPAGIGRVMVSYVRKRDRLAAAQHASQVGLGYIYPMSKRTDLFAAYGRINNSNGASYKVGNAIEVGSGNQAWNLGIQHRF